MNSKVSGDVPRRLPTALRKRAGQFASVGAFGYQALAALCLVLAVAHVLSGVEYARFSLTLATAQFVAIGAFEWVRIAATRFYPGPDPAGARLQKASLGAGFAFSALAVGLLSLGAAFGGISLSMILLGTGVAVGQGLTDLYLTFVRFRGNLSAFARLQSIRATFMVGLGFGGAVVAGSATGALTGIALAHASVVIIALLSDVQLRRTPWHRPSTELVKAQIAYGVPAAGASILHLGTFLCARFLATILAPGDSGGAALFALDILQRPLSLVTTVLHTLIYPKLVTAFDSGGFSGAQRRLRMIYAAEMLAIFGVSLLMVIAFSINAVVDLLTPENYRDHILDSAYWAICLFFARAALVNVSTIPLHLAKAVRLIFFVAVADVLTFAAIFSGLMCFAERNANLPLVALTFSSILTLGLSVVASKLVVRRSRDATAKLF